MAIVRWRRRRGHAQPRRARACCRQSCVRHSDGGRRGKPERVGGEHSVCTCTKRCARRRLPRPDIGLSAMIPGRGIARPGARPDRGGQPDSFVPDGRRGLGGIGRADVPGDAPRPASGPRFDPEEPRHRGRVRRGQPALAGSGRWYEAPAGRWFSATHSRPQPRARRAGAAGGPETGHAGHAEYRSDSRTSRPAAKQWSSCTATCFARQWLDGCRTLRHGAHRCRANRPHCALCGAMMRPGVKSWIWRGSTARGAPSRRALCPTGGNAADLRAWNWSGTLSGWCSRRRRAH